MSRIPRKQKNTPDPKRSFGAPVRLWKSLPPAIRFVLSFIACLIVLGSGYAYLSAEFDKNMLWFLEMTASISGWIISLFDSGVSYWGKSIAYEGFSVRIIDECTGLLEMVIYSSAVLAFSTSIRKKLIGLAFGVPLIYLFNIIRIVVLVVVGAMSRRLFDFLHLYFWQVTLIIIIASVWVGWLYLVVYREKKRPVAVSS